MADTGEAPAVGRVESVQFRYPAVRAADRAH